MPGILSMGEGLAFIEAEGLDAIRKRVLEQLAYLWKELSALEGVELYGPPPGDDRIAVLSLNIRGWEADDVGNILNHNHGIYVRTGLHCSPLAHQTLDTYPNGRCASESRLFYDARGTAGSRQGDQDHGDDPDSVLGAQS